MKLRFSLACGFLANLSISRCDSTTARTPKKNDIVVCLTDESKKNLLKFSQRNSLNDYKGEEILLVPEASKDDIHVYEPLFGDKVAFRIKAFAKTNKESQGVVAFGRVTSFVGDIQYSEFEPSLTLTKTPKRLRKLFLCDIPTRIMKTNSNYLDEIPSSTTEYKDIALPESVIHGKTHDAITVQEKKLSWIDQLVIDGYLCSREYLNDSGYCTFDRRTIVPVDSKGSTPAAAAAASAADGSNHSSSKSTSSQGNSHESKDKAKSECPLCRYMKAGQCKDSFLVWESCLDTVKDKDDVKTCYQQTKTMLECMRQYEYYDIMTANSDRYDAFAP